MLQGELATIGRAWEFQKAAGIDEIPVPLAKYLAAARAELKERYDLADREAGQSFPRADGTHVIIVNGNHSPERQRFTVLHELAHIFLGLPSKHGQSLSVDELLRYGRRPPEEILCDIFASECLMPRQLFAPDVRKRDCSFASVQELAGLYEASLTATGSRFAAYNDSPCAWILAEDRRIRFVSLSPIFRDVGFWVPCGGEVPRNSVLGRLLAGDTTAKPAVGEPVPLYTWTQKDCADIEDLVEEAILAPSLSQGLTLLCADDVGPQRRSAVTEGDEDDELLPELDGVLQFHKRTRRK